MNDGTVRTFDSYLEEARNTPFSGWDFGRITGSGRVAEAPLRWNYYNVVLPWLRAAETVLDMGTGGGETLARFAPLPGKTYATEQYLPNISVAAERLGPLGVEVTPVDEHRYPNNESLPFDDAFFDLIVNRHEAYCPEELVRILKPGGAFITQQVGTLNMVNLRLFLAGKADTDSRFYLKPLAAELQSAGLTLLQQEEDIQFQRFYDVGAVTYFMKAIPWEIEDFTIEGYRGRLWDLHLRIQESGFYDTPLHRILVVARK